MESSSISGVIVCEQTSQWATALRQDARGASMRIQEMRLIDDAWQALVQSPAAFLVLEVHSKNIAEIVRRLVWLSRDFPKVRAATVASRHWSSHRWLLQSAGAVSAFFSPRSINQLAEIAGRHIANAPSPQLTVHERIWLNLPWAENRSAASSAP